MSDLLTSLTTELRRGTLTIAVLSRLHSKKYGYSLVQELEDSGISVDQSTVYPLLRRLEKQELLTSTWDESDKRRRKYYVLSEYGTEIYEQLRVEWEKITKQMSDLLNGEDKT